MSVSLEEISTRDFHVSLSFHICALGFVNVLGGYKLLLNVVEPIIVTQIYLMILLQLKTSLRDI